MSAPSLADIAVALLAAGIGYVAGSLPASTAIGRLAGANPGTATVWMRAGPGWGLLALVADLAKGIVPVALAAVTFSWGAGVAAGVGAVAGASWPVLGRRGGGWHLAVLAGVLAALEPAAAVVAVMPCLIVLGGARLIGRNGRAAAVAVGIGSYTLAFVAAERDILRLAAVLALYGVTAAGVVRAARRR